MRFAIELEVRERANRPPAIIRLRSCIKSMWRAYGCRITSMKPIADKGAETPAANHEPLRRIADNDGLHDRRPVAVR